MYPDLFVNSHRLLPQVKNPFRKSRGNISPVESVELKEPVKLLRKQFEKEGSSICFGKNANKTRFVTLQNMGELTQRVCKTLMFSVSTNPVENCQRLDWLQPDNILPHIISSKADWDVQKWMLPASESASAGTPSGPIQTAQTSAIELVLLVKMG